MLSDEYNMPAPGDLVFGSPSFQRNRGRGGHGSAVGQEAQAAGGAPGLYRKDLARTPGEAMIRYKKGGVLTIKAAEVVGAGNVEVTGDLAVKGNLTVTGTITAQSVTASGDVVAGGKSLIGHTHTDSMGGGTSRATVRR